MRDPFPIVATLGRRLEQERTGWRDMKALVLLVAQHGPWDTAAQLADALGLDADAQANIYREVTEGPRDKPRAQPTRAKRAG